MLASRVMIGKRCAIQEEPAFFRSFVFRLALSLMGGREAAEDLTQEVLLRLHRHRDKLLDAGDQYAWARRVTVRCGLNQLKRRKATEPLSESLTDSVRHSEDFAVREVLGKLSPDHRIILGLAIGRGLSYAEIANALGIPEGTVASRLNAAKQAFRKEWER